MPAVSRFTIAHSIRVILALGWSDFRMKYRGSVAGFLWSFIFPVVRFLVIFHIFGRFARDIDRYPLYLFLGIILWEHFAQTTNACIQVPASKEGLMKKVAFPRLLLIFSVGWSHLLILGIYLAIYVLAMVLLHVQLTAAALLFPVVLLHATLLALGIGMVLGAFALRFRDIPHIWSVVLQVLFWLTPIMYAYRPQVTLTEDAVRLLSGDMQLSLWALFDIFIRFQPLSILLYDARRILLYADAAAIPSLLHLGMFTLILVAVFLAGASLFKYRSKYFLQEY